VGAGAGYNVNIPWPTGGMGDSEYAHAFDAVVMPVATAFDPDLVIVSAGFDGARGDPLGGCDLTPAGYAYMTHRLLSLARGRMVTVLEGGYNLRSISRGMEAVVRVMLGQAPPPLHLVPGFGGGASDDEDDDMETAAAPAGSGGDTAAPAVDPLLAAASAALNGSAAVLRRTAAAVGAPVAASVAAAAASAKPSTGAPIIADVFAPSDRLAAETNALFEDAGSRNDVVAAIAPATAACAAVAEVIRLLAPYWPILRRSLTALGVHVPPPLSTGAVTLGDGGDGDDGVAHHVTIPDSPASHSRAPSDAGEEGEVGAGAGVEVEGEGEEGEGVDDDAGIALGDDDGVSGPPAAKRARVAKRSDSEDEEGGDEETNGAEEGEAHGAPPENDGDVDADAASDVSEEEDDDDGL
jgi:hypothetical protein